MKKIWFQPFPSYHFSVKQMGISVLSGCIVFSIFYIMQPFNINRLTGPLQFTYSFMYGAVTAGCLLILTVVLPLFLPGLFKEEKWVVGKEVIFAVLTVLCIAAANVLAYSFLETGRVTIAGFFNFLLATLLVGLLPITVSVLIKQKTLLNKFRETAGSMNSSLQQSALQIQANKKSRLSENHVAADTIDAGGRIILKGEAVGEKMEILQEDVWCLATADNYVSIVYKEGNVLKTVLYRTTLLKMQEQLIGFDNIVRCHRGYIINLHKVQNITASAQGLKLQLLWRNELIPVGKTYMQQIKERLQNR
jgi:hypothetical protein